MTTQAEGQFAVQESDYDYEGDLVWCEISTHDTQEAAIEAFGRLLEEGRDKYSLRVHGPEGVVEWPRWDVRVTHAPGSSSAQICQLVTRADAELALKNLVEYGLWPASELVIVETTET